jgi:hypothetical protein
MSQFFSEMGFFQYPLFITALFLALQIIRATLDLNSGERRDSPRAGMARHAILVWGLLSALLGILGTVVGIGLAARAIEVAESVSPGIVWGGLRIALTPTVFGLVLLTIAAVAWLLLQTLGSRRAMSANTP